MTKTIKPLTSLRFVFSFMVFCSHLIFLVDSPNQFVKKVYLNIFKEGYIGVSFFFMLSGFILAYNYYDKIISKTISFKSFYINRFARIYPLHLITFLASIPYLFKLKIVGPFVYFGLGCINLLLLQSFIPLPEVYFSFNSPSWSISNEFFFYLLTPSLFLLFSKTPLTRILAIYSIVTIIFLFSAFMMKGHPLQNSIFYIHPFVRIVDFIIGIMLYRIFKMISVEKATKSTFTWMEIAAISLFVLFFYFHSYIPEVFRYSMYYWIPMSGIILIFAFQNGHISRLLSQPIFIYLGEISFGFYMIHQIVIRYFESIYHPFNLSPFNPIYSFSIFCIALVLSILSFEFFEKKANHFTKSIF
ncbi:acyltransferase family protein [Aquirufa sp. ROCK-SH2]